MSSDQDTTHLNGVSLGTLYNEHDTTAYGRRNKLAALVQLGLGQTQLEKHILMYMMQR